MKHFIFFMTTVTLLVAVLVTAQSVPCAWCGKHAEYQPRFIFLTFPLPNTIHWECSKVADFENLPYKSFPQFEEKELAPLPWWCKILVDDPRHQQHGDHHECRSNL